MKNKEPNTTDKCKNCGFFYGEHALSGDYCPVKIVRKPWNREWRKTKFRKIKSKTNL